MKKKTGKVNLKKKTVTLPKKVSKAAASRRTSVVQPGPKSVIQAPAVAPKLTGNTGIGEHLGSKIGGFLGNAAETLLHSIIGAGDYAEVATPYPVVNNTIMGVQTPMAKQIPMMHRNKETIRVTRREFIRNIDMTVASTFISAVLDCKDSQVFPWLSSIAPAFQEWKVLGMVFEFRSLSANALAAGTASMGSVSIAHMYDATEGTPTTKTSLLANMFSVSCKPSESMMMPIECDEEETPAQPLFVRINEQKVGLGPDLRFSTFGRLLIQTEGAPVAYTACGELWVTYDLLLLKPRRSGVVLEPANLEQVGFQGRTFDYEGRITGAVKTADEFADEITTDHILVKPPVGGPPLRR